MLGLIAMIPIANNFFTAFPDMLGGRLVRPGASSTGRTARPLVKKNLERVIV
jgi:hypothetical protein